MRFSRGTADSPEEPWHYLLSICRVCCPLPELRIDPLLSSNNRLNLPTISRIVPFAFPSRPLSTPLLLCRFSLGFSRDVFPSLFFCLPLSRVASLTHTECQDACVSTCASSHKIIYTVNRCSNYERAGASALVQKIAAYFRSIIVAGVSVRPFVRPFPYESFDTAPRSLTNH